MAKSVYITTRLSRVFTTASMPSFLSLKPPSPSSSAPTMLFPFPSSKLISKSVFYSTTATPYPLQYDMIISRPAHQHPTKSRHRRLPKSKMADPERQPGSEDELGFDDWVDKKLSSTEMDKSKRKYYSKRRKRMYGTDSEDENRRQEGNDFVELKQEVVELRTLHKKEEELYFYDAFAYPWEKDKHYRMVYQMEKKYFPDQCFDKAFLDPGQSNEGEKKKKKSKGNKIMNKNEEAKENEEEDKRILFFDDEKEKVSEAGGAELKIEVSEKKVEEFFKCLKKFPNDDNSDIANPEPFLSSRSKGLPPRWDSPAGTVLLVNKPKGKHFVSYADGTSELLDSICFYHPEFCT